MNIQCARIFGQKMKSMLLPLLLSVAWKQRVKTGAHWLSHQETGHLPPSPLTASNDFCFYSSYFGSQAKIQANRMLNKREYYWKGVPIKCWSSSRFRSRSKTSVICASECECIYYSFSLENLIYTPGDFQPRCWTLSQICISSPRPCTASRAIPSESPQLTAGHLQLGVSKAPKTQHL